ncbi:hypothetical protein TNCT_608201 [Trichonephila clavata]|uniref:Uncharacterized protein n=1 Tax=Trichonephila clavata TaxID=2740835 RepID=A0A8X6F7V3_TRICU|nr:hypothetical protein TNCT_608201 [Trichonephila clavata]
MVGDDFKVTVKGLSYPWWNLMNGINNVFEVFVSYVQSLILMLLRYNGLLWTGIRGHLGGDHRTYRGSLHSSNARRISFCHVSDEGAFIIITRMHRNEGRFFAQKRRKYSVTSD